MQTAITEVRIDIKKLPRIPPLRQFKIRKNAIFTLFAFGYFNYDDIKLHKPSKAIRNLCRLLILKIKKSRESQFLSIFNGSIISNTALRVL